MKGWANVLLESMACGVPVVATDVGGSAEVIGTPIVGSLLHARDPAALATLIGQRWQTPGDPAAVRRYAERRGWEHTARAQLDLLRLVTAPRDTDGQKVGRPNAP